MDQEEDREQDHQYDATKQRMKNLKITKQGKSKPWKSIELGKNGNSWMAALYLWGFLNKQELHGKPWLQTNTTELASLAIYSYFLLVNTQVPCILSYPKSQKEIKLWPQLF